MHEIQDVPSLPRDPAMMYRITMRNAHSEFLVTIFSSLSKQAGARNASEPQSSWEQGDGFLNSFQSFHKHTPDSRETRKRLQNPAGPLMQDQIANAVRRLEKWGH